MTTDCPPSAVPTLELWARRDRGGELLFWLTLPIAAMIVFAVVMALLRGWIAEPSFAFLLVAIAIVVVGAWLWVYRRLRAKQVGSGLAISIGESALRVERLASRRATDRSLIASYPLTEVLGLDTRQFRSNTDSTMPRTVTQVGLFLTNGRVRHLYDVQAYEPSGTMTFGAFQRALRERVGPLTDREPEGAS